MLSAVRFNEQQKFLKEEYKKSSRNPLRITLGGGSIIVPISYNGDIDKFIDDIFRNKEEKENYNRHSLNTRYMKINIGGEVKKVAIPYHFFKLNKVLNKQNSHFKLTQEDILKRTIARAIRLYRSTIRKTINASNLYPNYDFKLKVNAKYIKEIENLIRKHYLKKTGEGLATTFKWSASQTLNILAGVTGAIPAVAYKLLNKKYKFPKNRTTKLIEEDAIPYICKGGLKSVILSSVIIGGLITKKSIDSEPLFKIVKEKSNQSSLNKSFKITDEESFKALYDAAFPLLIQSMMPTEIYVDGAYSDNGKITNTAGLGSYWFPEDGNPQSSKWEKTSEYINSGKFLNMTGDKACKLVDGWFRYRDGGRVFKTLYKKLKGCELNRFEFAAIEGCTYNSEQSGFAFCNYVKENYESPIKCAAELANLKPQNKSYEDGIKKRHIHEALLYLNLDGYAECQSLLKVKKGVNSKGRTYYVSSVTQLEPNECNLMIEGLNEGRTKEAKEVMANITGWHSQGAETVAEIMGRTGMPYSSVINFEHGQKYVELDKIYSDAIAHYKDKDFKKAVEGFNKFIEAGGTGAGIHNDLAISYYNLKEYDKCIEECRIVLKSGESEEFSKANYNAGKAYEAKGQLDKAIENYDLAATRDPEVKEYKKSSDRVRATQQAITTKSNTIKSN